MPNISSLVGSGSSTDILTSNRTRIRLAAAASGKILISLIAPATTSPVVFARRMLMTADTLDVSFAMATSFQAAARLFSKIRPTYPFPSSSKN
jgi:hypothetical protein